MKMNQTGEPSLFAETFTRVWENRGSRVGMVLLTLIVLSCAAASMIASYGVNEMDLADIFGTPSLKHISGTDVMGRDLFSRLLYEGRYSLALEICAAVLSAVLGCLIGCTVGYSGGRAETLIMRFPDIWSSLPNMLLCIPISAVLGTGFFHTMLALAIGSVSISVRLIRGQILSECSKDYLEAAQSVDYSHLSIMFHHTLPDVVSPVIVDTTTNIGMNITMTVTLPYIGLRVQPSTLEWGVMLAGTRAHILNCPHLIMFPGIIIALTVLVISLIGDRLCNAMDPKLRG